MPEGAPPLPPTRSARPALTAGIMAETGLDEDRLTALVHRFYDKVRADAVLGPIFAERIADWGAHLAKMVDFWSSVALMTGRYHGAPGVKHAALPVGWAHFERWLALFRETAHETCPPAGAAHVILRAERIARALNFAIEDAARGRIGAAPRFDPASKETTMSQTVPPTDPAEITAYIESRYHARHREQLPDLAALAAKVEQVHADVPAVPAGLSALLQRLIGELEVHMKKEELILFPAIRRGGMLGIENPIAVMRADHDDHGAEVARIRALTADLTLPEGACRKWTALYEGLEAFIDDLEAHVALENDVLFPQFEPAPGR